MQVQVGQEVVALSAGGPVVYRVDEVRANRTILATALRYAYGREIALSQEARSKIGFTFEALLNPEAEAVAARIMDTLGAPALAAPHKLTTAVVDAAREQPGRSAEFFGRDVHTFLALMVTAANLAAVEF